MSAKNDDLGLSPTYLCHSLSSSSLSSGSTCVGLRSLSTISAGASRTVEVGLGSTRNADPDAVVGRASGAGREGLNSGGLYAPHMGHARLALGHWSLNLHLHARHFQREPSGLNLVPLHFAERLIITFFFQNLWRHRIHLNTNCGANMARLRSTRLVA